MKLKKPINQEKELLYTALKNDLFDSLNSGRNNESIEYHEHQIVYDVLCKSKVFKVNPRELYDVEKEYNPSELAIPFTSIFIELNKPGESESVKLDSNETHLIFAISIDRIRTENNTYAQCLLDVTYFLSCEDGSLLMRSFQADFASAETQIQCPEFYPCLYRPKQTFSDRDSSLLKKAVGFIEKEGLYGNKYYLEPLAEKKSCRIVSVPTSDLKGCLCGRLIATARIRKIITQFLILVNSKHSIKTLNEYEPGFVTLQSGEKKHKPLPNPYYELRLSRGTKTDQNLIKHKAGWNVSYCFDVRSHLRRCWKYGKTATVKPHKRGLKFINSAYIPKTYVVGEGSSKAMTATPTFLQKSVSFVKSIFQYIGGIA